MRSEVSTVHLINPLTKLFKKRLNKAGSISVHRCVHVHVVFSSDCNASQKTYQEVPDNIRQYFPLVIYCLPDGCSRFSRFFTAVFFSSVAELKVSWSNSLNSTFNSVTKSSISESQSLGLEVDRDTACHNNISIRTTISALSKQKQCQSRN